MYSIKAAAETAVIPETAAASEAVTAPLQWSTVQTRNYDSTYRLACRLAVIGVF